MKCRKANDEIWRWNEEVAEKVREKKKKYGNWIMDKKKNRHRHGRST